MALRLKVWKQTLLSQIWLLGELDVNVNVHVHVNVNVDVNVNVKVKVNAATAGGNRKCK